MTKSYSQLMNQIAKLQRAADAAKAKEVGGVVERIKDAILHYNLTPRDLFGKAFAVAAQPSTADKPTALAELAKTTRVMAKTRVAKKTRKQAKKRSSALKYRDEAGNTWTGNGQRPRWFKAAIESGKTREDLEIRD